MQSTLKRIANRLVPPTFKHPPSPVEADVAFPTMIASVDDESRPSAELIQIAYNAIDAAVHRVSLDDIAQRPLIPDYFNSWPGEHYRLLGGLLLTLQPKRVVEVGTGEGLSALAMKKYLPPGGQIITFDVERWDLIENTVLTSEDFDQRLKSEMGDISGPAAFEKYRSILSEMDFLFIDGPSDGVTEQRILENLMALELEKRPIILVDDIRLWSMLEFWREVPWPKLDLTSFGHWSGTGLIQMQ